MRRVLMLCSSFPPNANVAAQRPGYTASFLPELGWQPVVLSRDDPRYRNDPSLARHLDPDLLVKRVRPPDLGKAFGTLVKMGFPRTADRFRNWLSMPDDQYGWLAAVVREGRRLIRLHRPDAILCSCVPPSSAVAAALLRRFTRVPLVLDFHNEWAANIYLTPPTPLHAFLQQRLERWVVRNADAVVTLNPMHTEDYARDFPGLLVRTVQNGYDPRDYAQVRARGPAKDRPVVFTYAGAVYGFQSPHPVVEGLDRLVREGKLGRDEVEVRILGDPFRAFDRKERAVRVVVRHDVPHNDLPGEFAKSDYFFLCLEPRASRQLPAKLYEYLAARRPILAVAPVDGSAARLLAETGGGRIVAPGERLDETLLDWVRAARQGRSVCRFHDDVIASFERSRLAGQMAQVLDAVANR